MIERDLQAHSHTDLLAELERELEREQEQMQAPAQQQAVDRLFQAGVGELGQAARDAARSRGP